VTEVGDVLQALRLQGAARFDPVRFRFIEALAGRAASRQGEARRLLDSKLDAALEDYRTRFEQASAVAAGDLALAIKDHPDAADELSRCHHEGDFRRLKHTLVRLRVGQGARVFGELLDQLRQVPREALPGAGRDVGAEVHELSDEAAGLGLDLVQTHARVKFDQGQASPRIDFEHAQVGDDQMDHALAGERQRALGGSWACRPWRCVPSARSHADAGHQIHRAAWALDHLARHHPVGQVSGFGHFQAAEDGQVDVPAADHREGIGAGEKAAAGNGW
jgi:hypothetical protein